jgi:hypothetical protein
MVIPRDRRRWRQGRGVAGQDAGENRIRALQGQIQIASADGECGGRRAEVDPAGT